MDTERQFRALERGKGLRACDGSVVFADGFCVTMFVMWLMLGRYKISLFEDRAVLTPLWALVACCNVAAAIFLSMFNLDR